jgi:hypothetical protein
LILITRIGYDGSRKELELPNDESLNFNPFEDSPTKFERYLYDVQEAHAGLIIAMHKKISLIEAMFNEIRKQNEAVNRAVLSIPDPTKDEKVN